MKGLMYVFLIVAILGAAVTLVKLIMAAIGLVLGIFCMTVVLSSMTK